MKDFINKNKRVETSFEKGTLTISITSKDKEVKDAIKNLMEKKGISIPKLAKLMGIRRQGAWELLNGDHALRNETLGRIAKALDLKAWACIGCEYIDVCDYDPQQPGSCLKEGIA